MNSNIEGFVVFTLDGNRYALSLSSVQRIVRVVEITPLPAAPEIVIGIINVQGKIIPVVGVAGFGEGFYGKHYRGGPGDPPDT
ncbi:MAG: chemotaxis protein CheW [Deltaproteobacteria bacterium]|nr:chemotaxis protein CheW [Deltaproteobacteria bacterium]